jgi:hypothetical protein
VPVWIVDDPGSAFPPRPPRGHWGTSTQPDPTDTLLLTARVTKAPYGTFTVPFVYVNDTTTSPPIFAPPTWVPVGTPPVVVAKLTTTGGTQSYTDPVQLKMAMDAAADSGQPFSVDIYDPGARDAFANILTRTHDQLVDYLVPRLHTMPPLPPDAMSAAISAGGWALIILAIAVLILAAGVAAFTVLMGIAIIYAISKGYRVVEAEVRIDANTGTQYLHVKFAA